ncbi:HAD family hydrolase [Fonticella tunisiensis]|uniref:HAD superfamily hydrolase (TIGR01509 family)/HAD superfamily hydrolase (TIGR01549 family) n=1 Tax=Fonticella tunisiensis TaxID=1096341 RepID=A0A4R7KQE9_9CLOT|nr:HAD family phosphatase [Fonticella tunisiensis]TDT60916.1 HAD superfamily hydrolase (TIGR01509 family)/HAD superfamily hydrolase (TIGR01549 family) [Fonticella tunisiensis]
MIREIEAVIFDMDGTLIDSMWVWKQVDIDFLKRRGIELPSDLQKSIEGLSFTETAIYFKNRFNLHESIDEIKQEWTDMVREYYTSVIEAKRGVKEFLNYLKKKGYKIGMATSNYMELVEAVLKRNDIYKYFDVIVTTCEVPRDKSFPDVFIETAKRLNVSPEKCLVFEDTPSAILGARAAGMKVIGVYDCHGTCAPKELQEIAEHIIEDFNDIVEHMNI